MVFPLLLCLLLRVLISDTPPTSSSDPRVLIRGPGGDVDHLPTDTNSGLGGISPPASVSGVCGQVSGAVDFVQLCRQRPIAQEKTLLHRIGDTLQEFMGSY